MGQSTRSELLKACMLLGLQPKGLTRRAVIDAWKNQIAQKFCSQGTEEQIIAVNSAKDRLVRWLDGDEVIQP